MSISTTVAPFSANSFAADRPMPSPAPVTIATLPLKLAMLLESLESAAGLSAPMAGEFTRKRKRSLSRPGAATSCMPMPPASGVIAIGTVAAASRATFIQAVKTAWPCGPAGLPPIDGGNASSPATQARRQRDRAACRNARTAPPLSRANRPSSRAHRDIQKWRTERRLRPSLQHWRPGKPDRAAAAEDATRGLRWRSSPSDADRLEVERGFYQLDRGPSAIRASANESPASVIFGSTGAMPIRENSRCGGSPENCMTAQVRQTIGNRGHQNPAKSKTSRSDLRRSARGGRSIRSRKGFAGSRRCARSGRSTA